MVRVPGITDRFELPQLARGKDLVDLGSYLLPDAGQLLRLLARVELGRVLGDRRASFPVRVELVNVPADVLLEVGQFCKRFRPSIKQN